MHNETERYRDTTDGQGTVPTCSRRIFSPANFNQSHALPGSCFRFASREQSRQVENRLKHRTFVIDVASIQSNRNISELEYMRKINYGF